MSGGGGGFRTSVEKQHRNFNRTDSGFLSFEGTVFIVIGLDF